MAQSLTVQCTNPLRSHFTSLSLISHVQTRTIRSTFKPRPNPYNEGPGLPTLTSSVTAALARKERSTPYRTGAVAQKKGMTALFDPETGKRTPCTVLQLDRVQVISHKTRKKHGYYAVQIGAGLKTPQNVTRPELGHFARNRVSPKRHVVEFKVKDKSGLPQIGMSITPSWFVEGQYVDARANCRGMGFEGGMKKHGWAGQPASHGTSLTHRAMGSSGGGQGSGSRVIPGKSMPGRMGGQQVTVQSLKVLHVHDENGIVVVNGCVAGPKGCSVKIQDAIKKPWPEVPSNEYPSKAKVTESNVSQESND